jgi:hypothetical protein
MHAFRYVPGGSCFSMSSSGYTSVVRRTLRQFGVVLLLIPFAFGCDRGARPTAPSVAAGTQPASTTQPTSRAADRLDVTEAVFRHLFDHNNSGGRDYVDYFFLSVDGGADPPPELLLRFVREQPPVLPASMADSSGGHVKHKESGGRGMVLGVGSVTWLDENSADVEASWYIGPLASMGYTYRVTRADGRWRVTATRVNWIS